MSFGRPPSINVGFQTSPPDRGSFPLDHYGLSILTLWLSHPADSVLGECKDKMTVYMNCLKDNSNNSTPCRGLSKQYLDCRMDKYVAFWLFS